MCRSCHIFLAPSAGMKAQWSRLLGGGGVNCCELKMQRDNRKKLGANKMGICKSLILQRSVLKCTWVTKEASSYQMTHLQVDKP